MVLEIRVKGKVLEILTGDHVGTMNPIFVYLFHLLGIPVVEQGRELRRKVTVFAPVLDMGKLRFVVYA